MSLDLLSIDMFSGVGGLTEGLHQSGFETKVAFELEEVAREAYNLNHEGAYVFPGDIRNVSMQEVRDRLDGKTIHLLAGCPPCQGFSSMRRLNRAAPVDDHRNDLINEFVRFVKELQPYTFMMENVPGLMLHPSFTAAVAALREAGYHIPEPQVVNVKDYGVPQSRRRLIMVGSSLGEITIAPPIKEKKTVRQAIGDLPDPEQSNDSLHRMFPKHREHVLQRIKLTPPNGGSRKDLPAEYTLECHKKENVGFNDVYGRLRWDDHSTTITGGCLNPSKGRFLHPEQDRCISAREAALLQTFPADYKFPLDAPVSKIALMIGNALPPEFSRIQAENIRKHLEEHQDKIR